MAPVHAPQHTALPTVWTTNCVSYLNFYFILSFSNKVFLKIKSLKKKKTYCVVPACYHELDHRGSARPLQEGREVSCDGHRTAPLAGGNTEQGGGVLGAQRRAHFNTRDGDLH